jgi:hypothetical protein
LKPIKDISQFIDQENDPLIEKIKLLNLRDLIGVLKMGDENG